MEYVIRGYQEKDWQAVCRIHDLSRPNELRGSFDPNAFVPLEKDEDAEYLKRCTVFVAGQGLDIKGFAGIDGSYLAWLYVDPAVYGKGLGSALLEYCLDIIGEKAWAQVCGNNVPAINLYKKKGFEIVEHFVGDNAGYKGPSVKLAISPELNSWR